MIFHKFGEKNKPLVVLIHGAFTPWQVMMPIAKHFIADYRVIIPALNAHTSEIKSEFISIEAEAKEIEDYILSEYSDEVFAICGLSMGGAIANLILGNGRVKAKNAILDGAPLVKSGRTLTKIMTANYINIAEKSKARDKKTLENFKKHFLPEECLPHYLDFIDNISNNSIENMLKAVDNSRLSKNIPKSTKLMYIWLRIKRIAFKEKCKIG